MCRCIDADLGVCRLIRKAGIALELLELPAIDFIAMFAVAVVSLPLIFRHGVRDLYRRPCFFPGKGIFFVNAHPGTEIFAQTTLFPRGEIRGFVRPRRFVRCWV